MRKKVLVVDDQPEICRLVGRALGEFGYDYRTVGDSTEAIQICQDWDPDAIFTDIFMPDKDGLEIIRELRKAAPGVVLLAMSGGGGSGNLDVLRTARLMGARHVFAKPFSLQELKDVLQDLIGPGAPAGG